MQGLVKHLGLAFAAYRSRAAGRMFATASIVVCLCLVLGRPERLDAASYTVLHHLTLGEGSGSFGLVASPEALYGILEYGGMGDAGVIFAVGTNGIFTKLYDFTMPDVNTSTNRDGADPEAELIADGNMLYGTAASGGWWNSGTVYARDGRRKGFQSASSVHRTGHT